ncbi:MAG: hypothetical protein HY318_15895 [Armatimonadetes bacterium]|nr:hypothetical protein [Armatimonadota bacterium]
MKWVLGALMTITGNVALATSTSPFDVGNRAQLFVDQVLVRSSEKIAFTLHPAKKHRKNPLVVADKPWEGWRLEIYGSVLYDEEERIFKMWYIGEAPDYFPDYATMYATSKDGITWEKPLVGTIPCAKAEKHNAVAEACLLASVIKDKSEPDPTRRYKMVCWIQRPKPEGGPHTMVSPDGLHWTRLSDQPICRSSDVLTAYYDQARQTYVAFPKLNTLVRGLDRRCFGVSTSRDFLTWTEPLYAFQPDLRDDAGSLARVEEVRPILDVPDDPKLMRTEFYGLGLYPHESCTLAFPWVLTVNNNARYGNHEGPGELQLAVSRDLEHWERPFRIPCVPRGKVGEWDCGFFVTASQAIRVGDEVWLYYGGSNYTHGTPCLYRAEGTGRHTKFTGSIGLATWKLDRFVSADAGASGGSLVTVPLVFSGNRLELNTATRKGGSVTVEMLAPDGTRIARSKQFTGDNLRHTVVWQKSLDLGALRGSPVSLRFQMKKAELYSFAFRE